MEKRVALLEKIFAFLFCAVLLGTGCVSRLVQVETAVRDTAQQYAITFPLKVKVIGNNQNFVTDLKEILNNFGFLVAQSNYNGLIDYTIKAEYENLGHGYSHLYGGYSNTAYQKYIAKARLTVFDDSSGIERYYTGAYEYRNVTRSGSYYSSNSYASDPFRLAAKIAAMEAIGDFMGAIGVPHNVPRKQDPFRDPTE